MNASTWKNLERRVCRALGAERQPQIGEHGFARGSDDDGSCYFSVEVKRSKRRVPEGRWIDQARRQGKTSGRPWLLVVAGHGNSAASRPVAVLDFWQLVELAQQAGVVPEIEVSP